MGRLMSRPEVACHLPIETEIFVRQSCCLDILGQLQCLYRDCMPHVICVFDLPAYVSLSLARNGAKGPHLVFELSEKGLLQTLTWLCPAPSAGSNVNKTNLPYPKHQKKKKRLTTYLFLTQASRTGPGTSHRGSFCLLSKRFNLSSCVSAFQPLIASFWPSAAFISSDIW